MLDSQKAQGGLNRRHGRRPVSLAELRSRLAGPLGFEGDHQQRLHELSQRLARVQALGIEYARLELSEFAATAMDRGAVAV